MIRNFLLTQKLKFVTKQAQETQKSCKPDIIEKLGFGESKGATFTHVGTIRLFLGSFAVKKMEDGVIGRGVME